MPKAAYFQHHGRRSDNSLDLTRCPCRRCILSERLQSRKTIRRHLLRNESEARRRAQRNATGYEHCLVPSHQQGNIPDVSLHAPLLTSGTTSPHAGLEYPDDVELCSPDPLGINKDDIRLLDTSSGDIDMNLTPSFSPVEELEPPSVDFHNYQDVYTREFVQGSSTRLKALADFEDDNMVWDHSMSSLCFSDCFEDDEQPPSSRSYSPATDLDSTYLEGDLEEQEDGLGSGDWLSNEYGGEQVNSEVLGDLSYPTDVDAASDLPPAFWEHPVIRNIYIRVFVNAAFNHHPCDSRKRQVTARRSLQSLGCNTRFSRKRSLRRP